MGKGNFSDLEDREFHQFCNCKMKSSILPKGWTIEDVSLNGIKSSNFSCNTIIITLELYIKSRNFSCNIITITLELYIRSSNLSCNTKTISLELYIISLVIVCFSL